MTSIAIDWIYGRPAVNPQEDEDRAAVAAEKVLDDAGVDYESAQKEYERQWNEFDDEAPMTGLALVWIKAREAAESALTDGWSNPEGASCSIRAI